MVVCASSGVGAVVDGDELQVDIDTCDETDSLSAKDSAPWPLDDQASNASPADSSSTNNSLYTIYCFLVLRKN